MKQEELLKIVKEFFDREYEETKELLEKNPWWIESGEKSVWYAIQRCLGVAQFVQLLGADFTEVDTIYLEFREKFDKLLEER